MIHYVVPARAGSKGFPGKNRKLFPYLVKQIPNNVFNRFIVTSDDFSILEDSIAFGMATLMREEKLASDEADIKAVIENVIFQFDIPGEDIIVMLYLTYPQRQWVEVEELIEVFQSTGAKSLLCRMPVITNPYLCVHEDGSQITPHDYYRRQDYPKTYELSHYIAIMKAGEVSELNKNLYNADTYFHLIHRVIDVDYEKDLPYKEWRA